MSFFLSLSLSLGSLLWAHHPLPMIPQPAVGRWICLFRGEETSSPKWPVWNWHSWHSDGPIGDRDTGIIHSANKPCVRHERMCFLYGSSAHTHIHIHTHTHKHTHMR